MDTKLYKGVRFNKESILDVQTHYEPTETFQYTNFYPCQPPSVKKSLKTNFENRPIERGYLAAIVGKNLSEEKFADRKTLEPFNRKTNPLVKNYFLLLHNTMHPALASLKKILMIKCIMAPLICKINYG